MTALQRAIQDLIRDAGSVGQAVIRYGVSRATIDGIACGHRRATPKICRRLGLDPRLSELGDQGTYDRAKPPPAAVQQTEERARAAAIRAEGLARRPRRVSPAAAMAEDPIRREIREAMRREKERSSWLTRHGNGENARRPACSARAEIANG